MKSTNSKWGKIAVTAFAVMLCVVCVFTLVACDKDQNTNPVVVYKYGVYENAPQDVTQPIVNGMVPQPQDPVRAGYNFLYWAEEGKENTPFDFTVPHEGSVTIVPVWRKQGDPNDPNQPGNPDDPNQPVDPDNPNPPVNPDDPNPPVNPGTVNLHWQSKEDCGAEFVFSGTRPNSVPKGSTVTFELKVSPFYVGTPVVYAGATVLTKGEDGKYSFVANAEFTISVSGLENDRTPMEGLGTEARPYIITRPVHMVNIATKVNDRSDTDYNEAYFELGADLDFEGEALTPIGTDLLFATMFSGSFDGKGHTLSNFELESGYTASGLFGYTYLATIKNLNVVTDINVSSPDEGLFAAGIAAYSFASDIIGCSFNGTINVACDTNTTETSVYAAGIVGFMQGVAGSSSDESATATVSYGYVKADISSYGIYDATAIGGIVGGMTGNGILAGVNVYNCVADVNLDGTAMRTGGIAGWMRSMAAIDNCYSYGYITTQRSLKGGIVGETYNENSVTYSLSRMSGVSGSSSNVGYGIVGKINESGFSKIDDRETVLKGNVYTTSNSVTKGQTTYSLDNFDNVMSLMDWSSAEWKSADGVILPNAAGSESVPLKLTFVFKQTYNEVDRVDINELAGDDAVYGYMPISYVFNGDGLNTLTADNGTISYGYFLDEACTVRISPAFLINGHDLTVYVGFADYSSVAGEYFMRIGQSDVKLTFDNNGMMTMYTGGIRANYMYVYNGSYTVVHDAYFAYLGFTINQNADAHMDFRIDKNNNGSLTLYDTIFYGEGCETDALIASEYSPVIGKWYSQGQTLEYTFYADGSGVLSNGNAFTYTLNGKSITIMQGGNRISGMLSDEGRTISLSGGSVLSLDKYDEFNGKWEGDFNDEFIVSFDGVNTAKIGNRTFTYSIEEDVLISQELRAYFNENGMLVLELDGVTRVLGREGSYRGEWKDSYLDYTMTLLGIDKDGYGTGYDSNGFSFTYSYNDSQDSMPIVLFVRETYFGYGGLSVAQKPSQEELDKGKPDLSGMEFLEMGVYTPSSGYIVDDYNLTFKDIFFGKWNSPNGLALNFNGDGAYHFTITLSGGKVWSTVGKVTVSDNGTDTTVEYFYDRKTGVATFTYMEKEYTVTKNGDVISASVSDGSTLEFKAPDIMSANDWHVTGFKKISFNGQGNVGNGKVTMTLANGTENNYTYSFTNEDMTVEIFNSSSEVVYRLDVETKVLTTASGDTVGTLGVYSAMIGKVYTLYGTGAQLDLTELLDKDGYGTAMLGNIEMNLSYVEGMLMLYDPTMSFVRYLVYYDENTIQIADTMGMLSSLAFIPDEVMGVYYNADSGKRLEFDGSSFNGYMAAEAILTVVEDDIIIDEETYAYNYDKENGVYIVGIRQKVAESDEYTFTPVYTVSFTAVAGATQYTSEDGTKSIWLVPVQDNE